ncbi:uncharacterized protein LODBEIA_P41180 [Lodderomyces beijingensis]|uniref:Sec20 C-terminal domain-containing protein n=1 Tax=Lodderomyces beijingensis TaxID=1775926 RepID=A0ABP0ZP17_9ASCO
MDIYERLDQLQTTIFNDLDSLVQTLDEPEDELKQATEAIQSQINHHLLEFKDLLSILKLQQKQKTTATISTKRNSALQIYELKYESLKKKFRSLQVYINETQQGKLHEYRLKRFNLLPESSSGATNTTNSTSERDQLFAHRSHRKPDEKTSIAQQINAQNTKITTSLQTSRNLLSASILQSELNIDAIDQQSKDLMKLNENFIKFGDLLQKSQGIIKFIEKQDKADRQRIYLSVGFFLLCCCWVIYRRVLRRPLRVLFWSLFKIFNIFGWIFGGFGRNISAPEFSQEAAVKEGEDDVVAAAAAVVTSIIDALSTTSLVEEILSAATSVVTEILTESSGSSVASESPSVSLIATTIERLVDEL